MQQVEINNRSIKRRNMKADIMRTIMVLTAEPSLFIKRNHLEAQEETIDIRIYTDVLDFMEAFLQAHPQLVILDIDVFNGRISQMVNILTAMEKQLKLLLLLPKEKLKSISRRVVLSDLPYLIKPVFRENIYEYATLMLKTSHR